jgi:hypothetical protein
VSYLSSRPGPNYLPGEFNLPDNYNVLQISEIHAFEEFNDAESADYSREVARQVNDYVEVYDVDEIHVMGDTGTFNDVYNFLDELNTGPEVILVAGDEDKKDADPSLEDPDEFTGFYTQINSQQPFDVDVDYTILDEGFEREIKGHTVQATHHPKKIKREDSIKSPDPRRDEKLDDFFSVETYTNQNTAETITFHDDGETSRPESMARDELEDEVVKTPPSLQEIDYAVYDHLHMPYNRLVGDTAVSGLGGRKNNHQASEKVPEASMQLASFEEDRIHTLHFDAIEDDIFEHQVFDKSGERTEIFDVKIPGENGLKGGYLAVQDRFRKEKIPEEAYEFEEVLPQAWSERKTST